MQLTPPINLPKLAGARYRQRCICAAWLFVAPAVWHGIVPCALYAAEMDFIAVAAEPPRFVLAQSRETFAPWGVNYDHDRQGRLLEEYWNDEWDTVVEDFAEMRALGANVVRVHLQLGRFMTSADEPNSAALAQLRRLVELAEGQRLYLDVTGLGCYHKADVPAWYDELDETARWKVQARFWQAVATTCASSPAIFCYDLMNEPVVSGGDGRNEWLGPPFAGKHFVQFITRERAGRDRPQVARQWIEQLVSAIRQHDRQHLITVGLVPWSLDRPGLTSGFVPSKIAEPLDFVSVHVYPKSGKLDEARATLAGFAVGKPALVEETFPLECTAAELDQFIGQSRDAASGWIGFYWGQTEEECRQTGTLVGGIVAEWLKYFKSQAARDE